MQPVLDIVAKVLATSGMKLLVHDENALLTAHPSLDSDKNISPDNSGTSVTPQRLHQVMQSAQSIELTGWADTDNLNALAAWLRIEPTLCFVLVANKLEDVLARAIDTPYAEFDCEKIIYNWHHSHQKLLHFFYRHRERCILVQAQDCLNDTQGFLRACVQKFSVPLKIPKESLSVWSGIENTVALNFAKNLLESYPEALSLENELTTCVTGFAGAKETLPETDAQSLAYALLTEYRAQRAKAHANNVRWVAENTKLLSKLDSIQAENEQVFYRYHEALKQNESLSIEIKNDQRVIPGLRTELELTKIRVSEKKDECLELSRNNAQLLLELREVQQALEASFERTLQVEAQVNILNVELSQSKSFAADTNASLGQTIQNNTQLQEKLGKVEEENEALLSRFQQSLIDLESYILNDRSLQSTIAAEQEASKALGARLLEVTSEYESLSLAHVQLLSERGALIEQVELKQNALALQRDTAERLAAEQQSQLTSANEELLNVQQELTAEVSARHMLEAQVQAFSSQLDSIAVEHQHWLVERKTLIEQIELKQNALLSQNEVADRLVAEEQSVSTIVKEELLNIRQELADEVAAKQVLESQVQAFSRQLDVLDVEHQKWLEERKQLIIQIDTEYGVISELKNANESLLLELGRAQKLSEEQFNQHEHTALTLEGLELEKLALASRLSRLMQKYPMPLDFERLEILEPPAGDQLKTQWQLVGLDIGKRGMPSLLFATILEGTAFGFCFSRQQAAANGLVRWPGILATAAELIVSPVGDATTGPVRAETWSSLATSDVETLIALSLSIEQELHAGSVATPLGENISNQMLTGLDDFKRLSNETKGIFRYDEVRLKRVTVNDDYEHLWLEFDNVNCNDIRSNHFECRVACSELMSKRFGSFPKLEFPFLETQQPLRSWYVESRDDFGEKLELRFALPALFDVEIWGKLTRADQGFIVSLLERLPTILQDLELDGAGLHRPWPQWQNVVEGMTKCLAPIIVSELAVELLPVQLTDSNDKDAATEKAVLAVTPNANAKRLGARNINAATEETEALGALGSKVLNKRPTSSAFLGYLKES